MHLIETARGPVEFADAGSGLPVLYFHGTMSGAGLALELEHSLVDAGFRLVIPHRPGYFGTPLAGRRTSADCAEMATLVLDHLGIERAAVIGTSAGGPPAINFALRYPRRTAALLLQCAQVHRWNERPWGPPGHRWMYYCLQHAWSRWAFCKIAGLLFHLKFPTPDDYVRDLAGARFADVQEHVSAPQLAKEAFQNVKTTRNYRAGFANDARIWALENVLSEGSVDCPTLIVHDPEDPHAPVCHAEYAAREIAGAQLLTLELGGHAIWIGRDADAMNSARIDFLRHHLSAFK